jgi:hypothetical protein
MTLDERAARVAALNDHLRRTCIGGQLMVTDGVRALPPSMIAQALVLMRSYDDFNECIDPYKEHDFGCFDIGGQGFLWKIDCYDNDLKHHSSDPADPSVTTRIATLMLSEEY